MTLPEGVPVIARALKFEICNNMKIIIDDASVKNASRLATLRG